MINRGLHRTKKFSGCCHSWFVPCGHLNQNSGEVTWHVFYLTSVKMAASHIVALISMMSSAKKVARHMFARSSARMVIRHMVLQSESISYTSFS